MPLPLNDVEPVTLPVNDMVLAVCKRVAVVALPDKAPENVLVDNAPEDGLYVSPVSELSLWLPVAPPVKIT